MNKILIQDYITFIGMIMIIIIIWFIPDENNNEINDEQEINLEIIKKENFYLKTENYNLQCSLDSCKGKKRIQITY